MYKKKNTEVLAEKKKKKKEKRGKRPADIKSVAQFKLDTDEMKIAPN